MKDLWFIHLPKTGGVFLRFYFEMYPRVHRFKEKGHGHDGICTLKNRENYFTFGFVRNPWDYRVATYHYPKRINEKSWLKKYPTFEHYIKNTHNTEYLQCDKYNRIFYIDGEMVMDYVGKFETLHEDVKKIFEINGIQMNVSIDDYFEKHKDNIEVRNHSPHDHYTTYYTNELIDIVYEQEKTIVETYGYTFKGSK